ncbi:MAG: PQQ-binding-like beta-propeller repeat protein [Candidatus Nomurabacteria bacterium]|nr:MAG: PQQ-binding-like beta-propeller repeat protein [Candidatus Nomurabacteria bacterium]
MQFPRLHKLHILSAMFIAVLGLGVAVGAYTYSNWTRQQKGAENTSASTDNGPTANVVQGTVSGCVSGTTQTVDWTMVRDGELIVVAHSESQEKLCIYDYNSVATSPIRQYDMTQSERSPVVVGDVLYRVKKGLSPIQVEARSLIDGSVLWTKTISSTAVGSTYNVITAANGNLYIGAKFNGSEQRVLALQQIDGQLLWMRTIEPSFGFSTSVEQLGALAVSSDQVFIQFVEGSLSDGRVGYRALNASTGAVNWTAGPYGSGVIRTRASLIYADNAIYAAPDAYISLSSATGNQTWNQAMAATNEALSIAYSSTKVYYSERRSTQYAYLARSAINGGLSWTAGNYNGSIGDGPLVVVNNNFLYHCANSTLRGISTVTGFVTFTGVAPTFCNAAAVYNGILYVNGNAGSVDQGKVRLIANTLPASATTTVGVPTCSIDNGSNYVDCANLQYGAIVTHARTTCTSTAGVKEVQFTLTGPAGTQYSSVKAQTVVGATYTTHAPGTLVGSGQWTLTAKCVNSINESTSNQKIWTVGSAPSEGSQKLSIYEGSARFTDGETMEAGALSGDANIDWIGSDSIYVRPNTSNGSSFFQGVSALDRQSLYLSGGINAKPSLEAVGLGQNGVPYLGSAIASTFDGASFSSGGGAIYGGVSSCGAGKTCYAGYFNNSSETGYGILVTNNSASQPTLRAENLAGGTAANFVGVAKVSGDLQADNNTVNSCTWTPVSAKECPAGTVASGMRFSGGVVSEYNCCSL